MEYSKDEKTDAVKYRSKQDIITSFIKKFETVENILVGIKIKSIR